MNPGLKFKPSPVKALFSLIQLKGKNHILCNHCAQSEPKLVSDLLARQATLKKNILVSVTVFFFYTKKGGERGQLNICDATRALASMWLFTRKVRYIQLAVSCLWNEVQETGNTC